MSRTCRHPGCENKTPGLRTYCSPQCQSSHYTMKKRFKVFGATPEDYFALLKKQKGRCAICRDKVAGWGKKSLAFDHNHVTLTPRGLLCLSCNAAIGLFKDDPKLLKKAMKYLREYDG